MKILSFDTSGRVASVACLQDDLIIAEYTVNYKMMHSQTILPMIDEISNMIELDLSTVDAIALAAGPGSFTGLRIGAATAKGLSLAIQKPIIEVPTLDAIAYQLYNARGIICPIIDARRQYVYNGLYCFSNNQFVTITEQRHISIMDLINELNSIELSSVKDGVIFQGDGIRVIEDILYKELRIPFSIAPQHCLQQRAAAVAALGAVYYCKGKVVSASDHAPIYLRKSQAEQELERKERDNSLV